MIPTIGRIVLVNLGCDTTPAPHPDVEGAVRPQHLRPALVVRTWGNHEQAAINVQLFCDGTNDLPLQFVRDNKIDPTAPVWLTSIVQGECVGQWRWPPRV